MAQFALFCTARVVSYRLMSLPERRISNLISFLGGRTVFVATAKELNHDIGVNTVGAWITRNSIPLKHVPLCNEVAEKLKIKIDWSKVFAQIAQK